MFGEPASVSHPGEEAARGLAGAMPVPRRTVDHFEAALPRPWSLDRMGDTAREMADQVVAFRLAAESWQSRAYHDIRCAGGEP